METERFDYVIIGAGPAGLSAAAELSAYGSVLLLEKGKDLVKRVCPATSLGHCGACVECDVMSGLGGASGRLGGKLCFFPAGARLAAHVGASPVEANAIVVERLSALGCDLSVSTLDDSYEAVDGLHLRRYVAVPLLRQSLSKVFRSLVGRVLTGGGVVRTDSNVLEIGGCPGSLRVVYSFRGGRHEVKVGSAIVLAPGRSGSEWLERALDQLGVAAVHEGVDVGVRLEFPSAIALHTLERALQDAKFKETPGSSYGARTLCWCRGGELGATAARGTALVDGHFSNSPTARTSVSVVARVPLHADSDPLTSALARFYPSGIASGIVHQDLRSFMSLRHPSASGMAGAERQAFRSTQTPFARRMDQDLWMSLAVMIDRLDDVLGNRLLLEAEAVVYGPVVDRYWSTIETDSDLMTAVDGIYVAGDATGLARGIVQGIFSGAVVARAITQRIGGSAARFAKRSTRAAV